MADLLDFINNLMWDSVLVYLLLGTGIWFTARSGFIQFRHFTHLFTILHGAAAEDRSGISPFQALCISLAARIGCGNLMGVGLALTLGGPGAIVWMWLAAMAGMATAFAESTLAQLYKIRDADGNYRGGPAWYMAHGLGLRWMGVIFTLFMLCGYGGVFSSLQANAIAQSMESLMGISRPVTGLALLALSALLFISGMGFISRLCQWLVPAMAILYVLLALWVMAAHAERLPDVAVLVLTSAFGFEPAASGIAGFAVAQAVFQGIQRGLFSNGAGMGSLSNISAAARAWPPHPASHGYIQMLSVFIDTLVICSATAAIILTSGSLDRAGADMQGFRLIQQSLLSVSGHWSVLFVTLAVFVFSFASIIGNYVCAESCLHFFRLHPRRLVPMLRLTTLAMIMYGCLEEIPVLWQLANLTMGLMSLTNLIALLLLSHTVLMLARDYNSQRGVGKLPTFYRANFPGIAAQLSPGMWEKPVITK